MTRTVVLDNEAVQALLSVGHAKHRRALAHIQVIAGRALKGRATVVVVPTTVRVEAGWDRTAPTAAIVNRLRIADAVLDTDAANVAATVRRQTSVSPADAHLGATVRLRAAAGPVTVLTSDPGDVARVSGSETVTIVRI